MKRELYQFKHGLKTWYLTNHRKDITHAGNTYKAITAITRTNIVDESINKCDFDVTIPQITIENSENDNFLSLFLNRTFFEIVSLTLLEYENNQTTVLFVGSVNEAKFDERENTIVLTCSTAEVHLNRNILNRRYQKPCPNTIYDRWCGLDFEKWSFKAVITAINGLLVTFTVKPTQVFDEDGDPVLDEHDEPVMETKIYANNYLVNGLMKIDGLYTLVTSSTSNTAKLYRDHIGLKINDEVEFAPGCDQSMTMCHEKFNNAQRHCGHPHAPNENPIYTQLIK